MIRILLTLLLMVVFFFCLVIDFSNFLTRKNKWLFKYVNRIPLKYGFFKITSFRTHLLSVDPSHQYMVGYLLHPLTFDDWKWSFDKRSIHNEVTSLKIHTLVILWAPFLVLRNGIMGLIWSLFSASHKEHFSFSEPSSHSMSLRNS